MPDDRALHGADVRRALLEAFAARRRRHHELRPTVGGMRDALDLARLFEAVEMIGHRHERLAECDREFTCRLRTLQGEVGEQREELPGKTPPAELSSNEPVDVLADRPELDQVEPGPGPRRREFPCSGRCP
jgi:hypothetical protein